MKESPDAQHLIRYVLLLGIQFDDVGYRHLLDSYLENLEERFPEESFEDDSPNAVLDEVIPRLDPVASARTGGAVYDALAQFCRESWRLDLAMTASDFGTLEKRDGPYRYDRAQYHLGRRIVSGQAVSVFPASCPYRRSRRLDVEWAGEHRASWHELLPDALWWALNDDPEALDAAFEEAAIDDLTERLEDAGFPAPSLSLFMTSLETVHEPDEDLPA